MVWATCSKRNHDSCNVETLHFQRGSHGGATSGEFIFRRMNNQALLEWMGQYLE